MRIAKRLVSFEDKKEYVQLQTNSIALRVWFVTEDIIRIRAGFDENFTEGSYSLVTTAWEDHMDAFMRSERKRIAPASYTVEESENGLLLRGANLKVEVRKEPFVISVYDAEGTKIHADIPDLAYQEDANHRRIHVSEITPEDHFYGFGEKSGDINKAQMYLQMSPKDAMGYNPKMTDSLYKHIPFYIKLNEDTHKAVGYFYHNTAECDFNMGREKSNYWHMHSAYRTDAGDVDLFLIAGPTVREVVSRYTDLTGKSAMLPKQALGYLGSSMYYAELDAACDEAILKFMDTAEAENIPMDGFMLSSGYTSQETEQGLKRCVFCWNDDRFPDPGHFFEEMAKRGAAVSSNVKPGILTCHPKYEEMKEKGMFVRDSETDAPGVGTWWGGPGSFVDLTDETTRNQWKEMLKEGLLKYGSTSVWNDNCEYDSLVDKDCRCCKDGLQDTIGNTKAVMSSIMCRITREAMDEMWPELRPYVVCRSGHAGIQRYAQTWAGDNLTCWESLKYNIATILGMGLSGVANQGCDIGGFYGSAPDMELFVRWVQNGIFQPRFSIHSVNIDNTVTEPWMFEQATPLVRDAIWLRYHLMPYFYSLMYRAHVTGLPIMEPMCSAFQSDVKCYDEGVDFMLGDSLLVANVVEQGVTTRSIYLPAGETFYDFWTGEKYEGGQTIELPVTLASIPMFLKSGALLPLTEDKLHPLKDTKMTQLTLRSTTGDDATFVLYEDDGYTNAYRKGEYCKTTIAMSCGEMTTFHFEKEGDFASTIEHMKIEYRCPDKSPFYVNVAGKQIPHILYKKEFDTVEGGWFYNVDTKSVEVTYPNVAGDYDVQISFEQFDMIGM